MLELRGSKNHSLGCTIIFSYLSVPILEMRVKKGRKLRSL